MKVVLKRYLLEDVTAEYWELKVEGYILQEIANIIAQKYDVLPSIVESDLIEIENHLYDLGYLEEVNYG